MVRQTLPQAEFGEYGLRRSDLRVAKAFNYSPLEFAVIYPLLLSYEVHRSGLKKSTLSTAAKVRRSCSARLSTPK